jgi:hypothetical protein
MVDTLIDRIPPGTFDSPESSRADFEQKNEAALTVSEERVRKLGLLRIVEEAGAGLPDTRHPRIELMIPEHRNEVKQKDSNTLKQQSLIRLRLSYDPERLDAEKGLEAHATEWKERWVELRVKGEGKTQQVEVHASAYSNEHEAVKELGVSSKRLRVSRPASIGFNPFQRHRENHFHNEGIQKAFLEGIEKSQKLFSGTYGEQEVQLTTKLSGNTKLRRVLPIVRPNRQG